MIGVLASSTEHDVVAEFFELFKTPWELCRPGTRYDVLLCSGWAWAHGEDNVPSVLRAGAKLVLFYAGGRGRVDQDQNIETGPERTHPSFLLYGGNRIPIYGNSVTFPAEEGGVLTDDPSRACAALHRQSERTQWVRIGYDLFDEVRALLTSGQPSANAEFPALELHIALLRDFIVRAGLPLIEVPPIPEGYRFIACLTHDVDHPFLSKHRLDRTALGFLYRATLGTVRKLARGEVRAKTLVKNWRAAAKLPFLYLGLAKDIWSDFADRYLQVEAGLRSTYFLIPFKNRAGKCLNGDAPPSRAARYQAQELADTIEKLQAAGCEVGLHGIDAWLDSSRGREELDEIRRLTGRSNVGVRMHWLCYDQRSPETLQEAGAGYDSTIGYNENVGYRAGTTQVYRPLAVSRLLELPLHVMDTALFYPVHLSLTPEQATRRLARMVEDAVRFGGCLTINWHDRSLAPERLWDVCYIQLLEDLKRRDAWFATASEAVSWFRKRRSVAFETDRSVPGGVRVRMASDSDDQLPGLRLRIHKGREAAGREVAGNGADGPGCDEDMVLNPKAEFFGPSVSLALSCETGMPYYDRALDA
jgi:hypothetical protein